MKRRDFAKVAAVGVITPLALTDVSAEAKVERPVKKVYPGSLTGDITVKKGDKLFVFICNGAIYTVKANGQDVEITLPLVGETSFKVFYKDDNSEVEFVVDSDDNGFNCTYSNRSGIIDGVHKSIVDVAQISEPQRVGFTQSWGFLKSRKLLMTKEY